MNIVFKIILLSFVSTSMLISSDSKIIAEVNNKSITQKDIDEFIAKSLPGVRYSLMNYPQKQKVINQLVDRALYLEVAKNQGIENDPDYKDRLIRVHENLMLDVWMKKQVKVIPVDEKEIRAYYHQHDEKFNQEEGASARHILVSTESEAKEIIRDLRLSPNLEKRFIELAHERSTGPSRKNGGDIGWFNKDQMVAEFSDAALALRIGEISPVPVKTHFGYHIIYLTDKRPAGKVKYESVRESIAAILKLNKIDQHLKSLRQNLRKSADIKINIK